VSGPDVTVVLISYNDAARLPRALRSIQRQTLRAIDIVVVDDASDDDTESVVRRIAESDPRVRYERLAENSGGCSAPRNRGIDVARAPWVMFCDSDDEYERHACKNLLEAAERTGADVVCGTAERVDVRSGRSKRWRPEVHEEAQVVGGLADLPELLFDTISVNKIYRVDLLRRNGIRFPEGLLFEDQLFTLQAMAAAGSLATIPETVYRWYVDRLSDEPSITQRRNEARNVESRIEINRRIDAFLADRTLPRIAAVKDLKFLKHDLYLYLASMLEVDDETAVTLMDLLVPYVEGVDLGPAWQLRPALRVAIYHLLVRDLEGIRSAMRFLKWASVVDVEIVGEGEHEYWGSAHLANGPDIAGRTARAWLDVTELHLRWIPFSERRYLHRIDAMEIDGDLVVATGSTVDFDGDLATSDGIELRLLINGQRTAVSVPAAWGEHDGRRRRWRAEGALSDSLGRALTAKDRGTVALAVRRGAHEGVVSARASEGDVPRLRMPFPGRSRWTGPDAVELVPYENGAIGWRAVRVSRVRDRLAATQRAWFRIPGTTRLATVTALVRRDAVPAFLTRLGHVLPPRDLAVFEADQGRTFGGNVAAISRGLAARHPGRRQVWVFRSASERVPRHAQPVERSSLRHAWLMSRAALVVDDGASAAGASPRALVVNAGQGVPVHRVGLDDPSILVSRSAVASVRRHVRRWGLLLAPAEDSAATTTRAFAYRGPVATVGLPRMDTAISARSSAVELEELRGRLDLPGDRALILYAPSSRHADREPRPPLIDLDLWARALGERAYLLVRPHPGEAFTVPTRLRYAVRDLADRDDLPSFVAASDMLVSDYSSVIGDAALIDLPIVLFQPDHELYANRTRGLYPELSLVGPVAHDTGALVVQVRAWLDDPLAWESGQAATRRAWAAARCGPPDGGSTQRALDAILRVGEGP
jgi:CDP-glycerol glycerophosphotransferase